MNSSVARQSLSGISSTFPSSFALPFPSIVTHLTLGDLNSSLLSPPSLARSSGTTRPSTTGSNTSTRDGALDR